MTSQPTTPDFAAQKVSELSALESRLSAAAARALEAGYHSRASSYSRQVSAVRRERERWTLLLQSPPAPTPAPHLLAGALAVLLPLFDLFVAGGMAARRLAKVVLTIGMLVFAVVLGTSPPSAWSCEGSPELAAPVPWTKEIAALELVRKNELRVLPLHSLSRRRV